MSERKPLPKGIRTLINFSSVNSMVGEKALVCIPKSTLQIARDFIRVSGSYTGSYYLEIHDDYFISPDVAEFNNLQYELDEFLGAQNLMDCFDDLTAKLDEINTTLSDGLFGTTLSAISDVLWYLNEELHAINLGVAELTSVTKKQGALIIACCSGFPELPAITPGPSVPETDQPGNVSPTIEPTDNQIIWGSTTTSSVRCQTARHLIRAASELFRGINGQLPVGPASASQVMIIILSVLATIVTILALPVSIVVLLAAAIAGLSLLELGSDGLSLISDELEANEDDYLCIMTSAVDVDNAKRAIDSLLLERLGSILGQIAGYAFNNTNLSSLFYSNDLIDPSGESSTCPTCATCLVTVQMGSGPSGETSGGTYSSVILAPNKWTTVRLQHTGECGSYVLDVSNMTILSGSIELGTISYYNTSGVWTTFTFDAVGDLPLTVNALEGRIWVTIRGANDTYCDFEIDIEMSFF